jgi:release factor glutamine methyltransferase
MAIDQFKDAPRAEVGGYVDGSTAFQGRIHGPARRFLRTAIHFLAYHFVMRRKRAWATRSAGLRLTVRPTVFHPRYFISSECFANYIGSMDLRGKRVIDVGTGSGILAIAAAKAGAEHVVAVDINPNAALSVPENSARNVSGPQVAAACMDLLAAVAPRPLFDVILSNPPKHTQEPRDLADRGWHAGPNHRDIAALFEQARARLKPDGLLYVMLSTDSDLGLIESLIARAGFEARVAYKHSIFIESFVLYECAPRRDAIESAVIANADVAP